ncbi:M1 family metallopeptidase [Streptomyces sp. MMBL 11-3]|uniref:M1 family metallopeptidase n=1 Tax=Streptomyces sp. MMBL 11-3 TaxID=3382639 RepID=UPI0039B50F63
MPRSVVLAPVAVLLACVLAAGCDGGVEGVAGAPGVRDPYFPKLGNGGYDVTHYGLTLDYRPAQRKLVGKAVVTARADRDLSAFDLDLKGMEVQSVEVDGKPARFNRSGDHELVVRPREDLDEGASFTTVVRYAGSPEVVTDPDGSEEGWLPTADGALALGEPTGSMTWFPGNHHPGDKATYDITVSVPEGLRAVSNGELREERVRDGRAVFAWHVGEPMASYVATVAVGRFTVHRSEGDGKGGVPVYTAVDPREAAGGDEVLGRIPEIVEWGTRTFGAYPFSSAGAIVEREKDAGYALETQNRPVFPGAPSVELLVHELAHQWYGNSVTPRSWRDMWLNEGFATYAEWLWGEEHGGDSAQEVFDLLYEGEYFDDKADDDAVWAFPPARPPDAAQISDSPVYERGAMVLHRIRQTVGDEAFRGILRGWATAHRHGTADTADFTAFVEAKAPDADFSEIWDDWLYGEGKPDRA